MALSRANQQRALPSLRAQSGIGSTAAVWLTASVQIGFVFGAVTSTMLSLADRVTPQKLLAASALGAATCIEVTAARTDKPITELKTTVIRDDGTVVLDGTAICYTMDIATGTEQ
jgi:hypothetical protein